jgi:signal transduction histidine kinase
VDGTIEVEDLPSLIADPTQIRQLLQNLIGNALKFHRPDVPPVVRVSGEVIAEVGSESDQHGRCRLKIEDNGIGMEEKYLDRIFSPFKRLHGRSQFEGTGMGLAICRRIVERHGGDISVASTPGEGTCFTIELPLEQPDTDDRNVDLVFTETPSTDE